MSERYIKIITWTTLSLGLIIISAIILYTYFWRINHPTQKTTPIELSKFQAPTTPTFLAQTVIGEIKNINNNILAISNKVNSFDIVTTSSTTIILTNKPKLVAPGTKTKPAITKNIKITDLKIGQTVKIITLSGQTIPITAQSIEAWR